MQGKVPRMSTASGSGGGGGAVANTVEGKKVHMKSSIHGDEVLRGLTNLRQNDELCDFVVVADGRSLKVHKILLAATSDYFRVMLRGRMKESVESEVDLKGLSADAMQHIVDFIYSGELQLDMDNLSEVLNAGSHLQVHSALDLCSDFIIARITFANADEYLQVAETYSLAKVCDFFNRKVLNNFEEFSNTDHFLNLSPAALAGYLGDDGLKVRAEHVLCDLVSKWYAHDRTRAESLDDVVKCIRFGLMSDVQLAQLQQHWLTLQFPAALNYISAGVKYHREAAMGHPYLSEACKMREEGESLVLIHQGSAHLPFEVTAYNQAEERFYQLATDISGSRDCRIASVDNFAYICRVVDCGGGTLMNSLLRFDPRHLALQELNPCKRLRIDPALVSEGHWLYMTGGRNENFGTLDSVELYDVRSNGWVDLLPLPQPVHSHAGVACEDLIYVSGGTTGREHFPTSQLYCYNPATRQWDGKAPMQCARRLHAMACVGHTLFVLGGIGSHNVHQQTQIPIESYSVASDQWTMLTSTLAGRSVGHFLPYRGGVVSISREHYEATEEDIWTYDVQKEAWSRLIRAPRRTALATASGALLFLNFFDEKIAKRMVMDKR